MTEISIWVRFVLAVLATWRVTHLLASEDGPANIIVRFRALFGQSIVGKGIQESILDLCSTVPIHFIIADGIVAMEGNGPLNGTPRTLGKIVLADDPVAADATCARLMGFDPDRIVHIHESSRFLGNASTALIDQVGETVNAPPTPFQVVPEFRHLYAM